MGGGSEASVDSSKMRADLSLFVAIFMVCGCFHQALSNRSKCPDEPWNGECPCYRQQVMQRRSQRSVVRSLQSLHGHASTMQGHVLNSINNLTATHYHHDDHYTQNLRDCNENFISAQCSRFLNDQCDVSSLRPSQRMSHSDVIPRDNTGRINEFLRGSVDGLRRVAAYVEQAERTPQSYVDFDAIKDAGLYYIMCELTLHMNEEGVSHPENITRSIVDPDCLAGDNAKQHNLNFMVFDALEKILHNIALQLRDIDAWSSTSSNRAHKRMLFRVQRE
ncbi:hypothetical protein CAPTEDRAFT_211412 [Capitella teleta]|uniref:Uncharacterized protein n=1 Tax=Capitella teleta TaxID=283909 RepID=R7U0P4_CAPTE|nr:hypothetical protein CAPTEDRAFT_211412 [Capitella teleta]|eukprot:ELT97226.1 hypothetical protein CAPTEDRAFT_211412 [Capitella teleta]